MNYSTEYSTDIIAPSDRAAETIFWLLIDVGLLIALNQSLDEQKARSP
jgi:hypothetical protein